MDEPTCCDEPVLARDMCAKCYYLWWDGDLRPLGRQRGRAVKPKTCQQCGATFAKYPKETYAQFEVRKFCGKECRKAGIRGIARTPNLQVPIPCQQCGTAFMAAPWQIKAGRKFCGRPCADKARDQGRTPMAKRERESAEMRAWRLAVFERDDWTCQECGVRGGAELNADHIKPFALFPELRFDVDNGRTLCVPCHKQTDTYGIKLVWAMRKGQIA